MSTLRISTVLPSGCEGRVGRGAEGLRCGAQVQWITFHSGYDFGYLLKVLTCQPLPPGEAEFFELLQVRPPAPACLHSRPALSVEWDHGEVRSADERLACLPTSDGR